MQSTRSWARPLWRVIGLAVGLATPLLAAAPPAPAYRHIELEASSPAPDEVVAEPPSHLRLVFSARIEARYTSVALTAPDGGEVQIGDVVFVDGSDHEITALLPTLVQPGRYTVNWRTAGADGHVLEGSWSFVLAIASRVHTTTAPGQDTVVPATAPGGMENMHAGHAQVQTVGATRSAIGRGLHFVALLLLIGAIGFRVLLLPRLRLADITFAVLQRRVWWMTSMMALLLIFAAVLRLWAQSVALHGSERAWSTALLSIMLADTGWGRAWVLQAFLIALLGMAIVWARPRYPPRSDRAAVLIAVPAILGLSIIPALTGHAAGATGIGRLAIVNDALHVVAGGAWLGTLAFLVAIAVPAIRQLEAAHDDKAADAVDRFSVIALTGAGILLLTGVINALMHLTTPLQLVTTGYGRTLLIKIVLVAGVAIMGLINWRVVRPLLRDAGGMRRLRFIIAAELAFAFCVLIATTVLTGQARP